MPRVVIGVDPHKGSNTLVVIDAQERMLTQQRFGNDRAGYRAMKTFARAHRDRVWGVEGARGPGTCRWCDQTRGRDSAPAVHPATGARRPAPRGLPTRREQHGSRQTTPLVRRPRTLPRILDRGEVDALLAALRMERDRAR